MSLRRLLTPVRGVASQVSRLSVMYPAQSTLMSRSFATAQQKRTAPTSAAARTAAAAQKRAQAAAAKKKKAAKDAAAAKKKAAAAKAAAKKVAAKKAAAAAKKKAAAAAKKKKMVAAKKKKLAEQKKKMAAAKKKKIAATKKAAAQKKKEKEAEARRKLAAKKKAAALKAAEQKKAAKEKEAVKKLLKQFPDPARPPQPASAWALFLSQQPVEGEAPENMKRRAAEWKALPEQAKKPFIDEAKKRAEAYPAAKAAYEAQGGAEAWLPTAQKLADSKPVTNGYQVFAGTALKGKKGDNSGTNAMRAVAEQWKAMEKAQQERYNKEAREAYEAWTQQRDAALAARQ